MMSCRRAAVSGMQTGKPEGRAGSWETYTSFVNDFNWTYLEGDDLTGTKRPQNLWQSFSGAFMWDLKLYRSANTVRV